MGEIALQFSSFQDFLAMGKHGFYVWSAYGVTLVIVLANVFAPILKRKELMAEIRRNENRKRQQ